MELKKVFEKLDDCRDEMASSLSRLVSIPSIARADGGEHPFGEPVQQAFEAMLGMAVDEGFLPCNLDNYGGHFDFPGKGEGILGIIGHLDVVPEGDGWDFEPFGGEIVDGFVCGRGTMDDKGPVIACFYAMKALKACGFVPEKTVRVILGLDEETRWEGMRHYVAFADSLPDIGFTPDADFPVVNGEMGILVFDIARKFGRTSGKGLELRSITGGTAPNCVADHARAVILDTAGHGYDEIRAYLSEVRESRGWDLNFKGVGKSLEITVRGKTAHGSKPHLGENAISILMEVLGHLNFLSDETTDFVRFYNDHIGFDFHGEQMGCALEDEPSGKLIWNVGMIDFDQKSARLTINVRYPVTADADQVYEGVMSVLDPHDLGIIKVNHQAPIYVPEDSPMVQTLMDIYRRQTGDEDSAPMVIGGGTYARSMDNIIAFGARFPDQPALEHQPNERISIDTLVRLARIYAETIVRLAGEAESHEPAAGEAEGREETDGEE